MFILNVFIYQKKLKRWVVSLDRLAMNVIVVIRQFPKLANDWPFSYHLRVMWRFIV